MRFLFLASLLFVVGCSPAHAQRPAFESSFTRVLGTVVASDGSVRYDRLQRGPERVRLDSVLGVLETYPLATLTTDPVKTAFWINAYNALMLDAVARQPGRKDVLGADGGAVFFKTPRTVGGTQVTLDQIENVVLRRQPGPPALSALRVGQLDPRIHVALNCAAVSCPRLRPVALTPQNLDAQLDAGMRAFVNSPRHFAVDGNTVRLSSLLDWFGSDFDTHAPAGTYLVGFLSEKRPGASRLRAVLEGKTSAQLRAHSTKSPPAVAYFYDWTVNRASRDR